MTSPPDPYEIRKRVRHLVPTLVDLSEEVLFGKIRASGTLSKRERSLITVAALVTLCRDDEIAMNFERAVADGLSVEELGQALTQLAFYAGWPASMRAARILADLYERQAQA